MDTIIITVEQIENGYIVQFQGFDARQKRLVHASDKHGVTRVINTEIGKWAGTAEGSKKA